MISKWQVTLRECRLWDLSWHCFGDLCLSRFLPSKVVDAAKNTIEVTVPVTRSDVMHECDLIEDLAIS